MGRTAKTAVVVAIAGVLVATAALPGLAQPGPRGQMIGQPATVPGAGFGYGRGLGLGYGGWWKRVTPTTPEEKAFVERITALHNELRQLVVNNAPADRIAAKRTEICNLVLQNAPLVQKLAPSAGRGWGRGRRFGMGLGPGLNPYCPFAIAPK
ncbi:MAG: hypothetical protein ACUVTZ_00160 [Armatimonadota bacterium]